MSALGVLPGSPIWGIQEVAPRSAVTCWASAPVCRATRAYPGRVDRLLLYERMCGDNRSYQTINVGQVKGYLAAAWSLHQRWDVARPSHASRARAPRSQRGWFSHTGKLNEAGYQRVAYGPHTMWVTGKTQVSRPNPTRHGQRPVLGEAQVPACARHPG